MALENVTASLVLDVINHDKSTATVKAIALDSKTRYVRATITQDGLDYPVEENATVTLTILRPDNVGVQVTGSVVDVDNADRTGTIKGVYAELSQAALAKAGTLKAQFKITSGEQILRTEIFQVKNGIALDGETDTWAGQYEGYNLDELVENVNNAVAKVDGMETDVSKLKEDLSDLLNSAFVTDSASGGVAHFEDGADNVPLKSLKVNIEPVQSGSGDPSPSNVRAISGWDSVKVTRSGKNLWNPSDVFTGFINNNTNTIQANSVSKICYIRAKPNTTYTVSKMVGKRFSVACSDVEPAVNAPLYGVILDYTGTSITITTENSTKYVLAWCYLGSEDTATEAEMLASVQFELGSDATEYEPYNGVNVSIDLGRTVYGGTLDVISGELTVTTELYSVTGASGTATSGNVRRFFTAKDKPNTSAVACNSLKLGGQSDLNAVFINDEGRIVMTPDWAQSMTTAEEFNTALASHPIILVITLTNPLIYQLTATEVKSLLGINNVWSDADDVDVEYRADIKLYIDKRLAGVTA